MRNYLNIPSIIVFAVLLLALPMCKQNPAEPQFKGDIVVSVVPNIGTIHTTFEFRVHIVVNGDTAKAQGYRARWDWDGDKDYETPWLDSLTAQHLYGVLGKKMPEVQIESPAGGISLSSTPVYVQEVVLIWGEDPSTDYDFADWSRDGTNRIAFSSKVKGSYWHRIGVLQYPGGAMNLVTPDSTNSYFAEWSYDGKKIAFTTGGGLGIQDLVSGIRTYFSITFDQTPYWSPDGRYIAYGNLLYDLRDSSTSTIPAVGELAWSPDGNELALLSFGGDLTIVAFPGYAEKKRYRVPGNGFKLEWSANGRWISLGGTQGVGPSTFYLFNLETTRVYSWRPDGWGVSLYPTWSQDGTLIAFEGWRPGSQTESIRAIRFPEDLY